MKKDFTFKSEWWDELNRLTPDKQMELINAVCRYAVGYANEVDGEFAVIYNKIVGDIENERTHKSQVSYKRQQARIAGIEKQQMLRKTQQMFNNCSTNVEKNATNVDSSNDTLYINNIQEVLFTNNIDYIYSNNIYSSITTNSPYICVNHICSILSNINVRESNFGSLNYFVLETREGMYQYAITLAKNNLPIRNRETIEKHWRDLYMVSGGDSKTANMMLDKAKKELWTDLIRKNYGRNFSQGEFSASATADAVLSRIGTAKQS